MKRGLSGEIRISLAHKLIFFSSNNKKSIEDRKEEITCSACENRFTLSYSLLEQKFKPELKEKLFYFYDILKSLCIPCFHIILTESSFFKKRAFEYFKLIFTYLPIELIKFIIELYICTQELVSGKLKQYTITDIA